MKYYLAIDLGATSGRHIVAHKENGEIVLNEIHRFKTYMDDSSFGLVWDIPRIFNEIKEGIKKAFSIYKQIESISFDSWGVDYVLMDGDKEILPFYAYRNERNTLSAPQVHKIIDFKDIYKKAGIQYLSINTIYQLYDDKIKGRLDKATDYLMIPSYFSYKLTGVKTHEYTDESTTSLLIAGKDEYDLELIDKLGLPRKLFGRIEKPGFVVGSLLPEIQKEVGGNSKVVLCASHDTASAFESVDVPDDGIILSSGTWSLLGIKTKNPIISDESLNANYTNEGGVGYIRFLKNIMGTWIANQVSEQENISYLEMQKHCDVAYKELFDVNDESLLSPKNMKQAVINLLKENPPKDNLDLYNSIYRSLAYSYKKAIDELELITNKTYSKIYVLGGGAKNLYLNKLIKEYTKKEVVALPIEATSLGNIKIQMKVGKEL